MQFPPSKVWVSQQVQDVVGKGEQVIYLLQKPEHRELLQQETAFDGCFHQAGLLCEPRVATQELKTSKSRGGSSSSKG